jgi:Aerotolerance regulator N-terminal
VIFLHPLMLLGLGAAAIPALLHLFQRRTPPELEFPPLRYLTEAERRSARRLRLRHLLLLALRTALIVVLVLAAARPQVPIRAAGAGGTHPPTALALVLDNSLSSGAIVGGEVTLDRLKVAARGVIDRTGAGDRLWLVLADGVVRSGSREELRRAVDSAPVQSHRLDLVAAVREAVRVVDPEPVPVREVAVISDLQRSALGAGRVAVPAGVHVRALAAADHVPENRGIASVRVTESGVAVSVAGTSEAGAAPVTLRFRGRDVARALARPGATVTLPLTPTGPGWWTGAVQLEPDELRGDDRRDVVWHTVPPARVQATVTAGPFVTAALAVLRAARRVSDGGEVTIGDRPGSGAAIVLPPADPALVGEMNRALAARGIGWQVGQVGPPGRLESEALPDLAGIPVGRRYRLTGTDSGTVLASVNGDPWAVATGGIVLLGSRLDTSWTALPTSPAFVPFLDAMTNRFVRGETAVTERDGAPRVEFATVGTDTVGATVYGPDPRESDLTPATSELARASLGADVLQPADFAAAAFAGMRHADLAGLLLAIALLLALVELGVATLTH